MAFVNKDWSTYTLDTVVERKQDFTSSEKSITDANKKTNIYTNSVVIRKLPEVDLSSRDHQVSPNLPVWYSFDSSAGLLSRSQPDFTSTDQLVGRYETSLFNSRVNIAPTIATAHPYIGGGTWGWLYAYTINLSTGGLTYWWDSSSGLNNCNQNSKADGWLATAFTEPTLANGAAYVPTACAVTGTTNTYNNCLQVPSANIASGILVFSSCSL